jgi:hypothetical protein
MQPTWAPDRGSNTARPRCEALDGLDRPPPLKSAPRWARIAAVAPLVASGC